MAKSGEKIALQITQELLKKIGVEGKVVVKEETEDIKIEVAGENLGALIGYHGETLESLQLILGLIINNQLGETSWKRVVLDIGNWRSERLSTLETMVDKAFEELKNQNLKRVSLPPMSAGQRREVHLIVSEKYPDLTTESEGQEPNRRVALVTAEK